MIKTIKKNKKVRQRKGVCQFGEVAALFLFIYLFKKFLLFFLAVLHVTILVQSPDWGLSPNPFPGPPALGV